MKKPFHLLFVVLFFGACLVPGLGLLLNGPSPAAANETPVRAPSLINPDGALNTDLLSDAADWFSHSYGFRRELITVDSAWKAGLLHSSAQPLVALGEDGWLFYAETLDDYTGGDSISPRQAYCIAHSLAMAQESVKEQGSAFAFTIAPNKASLYPQYLSGNLTPSSVPYAAPVIEALAQEGVNYADLFEPLAGQEEILYFRQDSHWNNRGAALAHDILLNSLGLPAENAFSKEGHPEASHKGDLYEMLYPASTVLDQEFVFTQPLSFEYTSPIRDVDDLSISTASSSSNEPLLMFRDSFGNALHSLMAESFSSALFSRAMPYNLDRMGSLGAKYVVVEIVERNLPLLAEAPFVMPAPRQDSNFPWYGEVLGQRLSPAPLRLDSEPAGQLHQHVKATGSIEAPCDPDSPVYLLAETPAPHLYEAFPVFSQEGQISLAAYLPEGEDIGLLRAVYRYEGQWRLAEQAPQSSSLSGGEDREE